MLIAFCALVFVVSAAEFVYFFKVLFGNVMPPLSRGIRIFLAPFMLLAVTMLLGLGQSTLAGDNGSLSSLTPMEFAIGYLLSRAVVLWTINFHDAYTRWGTKK